MDELFMLYAMENEGELDTDFSIKSYLIKKIKEELYKQGLDGDNYEFNFTDSDIQLLKDALNNLNTD